MFSTIGYPLCASPERMGTGKDPREKFFAGGSDSRRKENWKLTLNFQSNDSLSSETKGFARLFHHKTQSKTFVFDRAKRAAF